MQTVQGLLLGICFAGVLGGIVHLLSPGGSTDRMLRFAATLFMMAAAVIPIRSLARINVAEPAQMQQDAAVDAVLRNAKAAIEQTAQKVLDKYGYSDAVIAVTVRVTDGQVHAQEFVITGIPAEKAQEITHEIFSLTGEMPRVETRAAKDPGE